MRCTANRKGRALSPGNWVEIIFLDSKATKAAFWIKPSACSLSRVFPPQGTWEKEHGRLDRRRIARVAVSPEEIGFCGCWRGLCVLRFFPKQKRKMEEN